VIVESVGKVPYEGLRFAGSGLEHLAKHSPGEAYRRYAGGYVHVGSGSGLPASARPTIGLPPAVPERCFIVSGFPAFRKE
jgi:hypothetical protein